MSTSPRGYYAVYFREKNKKDEKLRGLDNWNGNCGKKRGGANGTGGKRTDYWRKRGDDGMDDDERLSPLGMKSRWCEYNKWYTYGWKLEEKI